ncbi:MAG: hypothetical protein V1824_02370 [archaeon]
MVCRCIECAKIIDSTRIYCSRCQGNIQQRVAKREDYEARYKSADYFERLRLF